MHLSRVVLASLALAFAVAAPLTTPRAQEEDLNYQADELPLDPAEIVKSFGFDKEQRIEVAAGGKLVLSETLQVFELPDFDPMELRDEMSFAWSIDGMKPSAITNADQWDAELEVPGGTKPGNYRLKVEIGYQDARRSIDRPIEVTAP